MLKTDFKKEKERSADTRHLNENFYNIGSRNNIFFQKKTVAISFLLLLLDTQANIDKYVEIILRTWMFYSFEFQIFAISP